MEISHTWSSETHAVCPLGPGIRECLGVQLPDAGNFVGPSLHSRTQSLSHGEVTRMNVATEGSCPTSEGSQDAGAKTRLTGSSSGPWDSELITASNLYRT